MCLLSSVACLYRSLRNEHIWFLYLNLKVVSQSPIFNRNTLKLSYSCTGNIKTIISNHNKAEINKATRTNDQKKNCNCRKPNLCPMDGNCNAENVIYQAEDTTSTTKETYIGLCDTTFKLRYRNHICSFRNERYKHATELSKHIWSLKDQKIAYQIKSGHL